jgi:glycosidase
MKFLTGVKWAMLLAFSFISHFADSQHISRCDPPFWFKNIGQEKLQLLLYGDSVHLVKLKVIGGPRLFSEAVGINPGYRIIYLSIKPGQGNFTIETSLNGRKCKFYYVIKEKPQPGAMISAADRMYLLMPDRFANVNDSNDNVSGMLERADRGALHGRHGGDVAGVSKNLAHIKNLGFNALWMTPLLENNQPSQSYHGYACTDHYRIDPRFGSNEEYVKLAEKSRNQGIKWVLDMVYNHVGNEHTLYKKRIADDWFHIRDTFFRTNYRVAALSDPYAAQSEVSTMLQGWFDHHMPDLNQDNFHVYRYLIQNTLWWVATTQASAVRVDTYPYSQQGFLVGLNQDLKTAFPALFVFGETWEHTLAAQSVFAPNKFSRSTGLPHAVTDFQFCFALHQALNEPFGWNTGISRLYYLMASDYVYHRPEMLVTFADNHDLNRMHATFGKNMAKTKMALGLMYMCRGIPCVFYGTEWLMTDTGAHGAIRRDAPGGWKADEKNGFTTEGLSSEQREIFHHIKGLASIRERYAELFEYGQRTQYIPFNGMYAFFIEGERDVIGVFVNQSDKPQQIDTRRYPDIKAVWTEGAVLLNPETKGLQAPSVDAMGISVVHYPKGGK